ncbi:MAG: cysteine synthase A, partial [Candidatus Omnitrophota bacterium]
FNPLGSIKDRVGVAMINDAEKKGLLKKGGTIIEATSGNAGIALSFVAAARSYRIILVMPETVSSQKKSLLESLGAELVLTSKEGGMRASVERAEELFSNLAGAYMPRQFKNPANPQIHRDTTAQEILADMDGNIDIFVAGVGTGGTITGVGEVLKEKNLDTKIVAVEPLNSPVLSGGVQSSHGIEGIGAGFIPEVLNRDIIDEVIGVSDEDAFVATRALAEKEGISAGPSSGAVLFAALQIAARPESNGKRILVIFPDGGIRYLP